MINDVEKRKTNHYYKGDCMKMIKVIALSVITALSLYGLKTYAEEQHPMPKPEMGAESAQQTWAEWLSGLASQAREKAQGLYKDYGKPAAEYATEKSTEALEYAKSKGGETYEASKKLAQRIYEAAVDYAQRAYEGAKTLHEKYIKEGSGAAAQWLKTQSLDSIIAMTEALKLQLNDAGESLKAHAQTLYDAAQTEAPKLGNQAKEKMLAIAGQLQDTTREYAQLGADKTAQFYAKYEPKIAEYAQQLADLTKNKTGEAAEQIKKTAAVVADASKEKIFQVYDVARKAAVKAGEKFEDAKKAALKYFEEQEEKPVVLEPGPVIIANK